MNIFEILFYQPLYNFIIFIYKIFGENIGIAIIIIAFLSRLLLFPLTKKQSGLAQSSKLMQEEINKIKEKYKGKDEKIQAEMLEIQKKYLPMQLGGCLPLIVQLILTINIYSVITNIISKNISGYLKVAYSFNYKFIENYNIDFNFFSVLSLNTKPVDFIQQHSLFNLGSVVYIILIVLVGLTQFYSTKLTTATIQNADSIKKDKNEPVESFSDAINRSTKQTLMLLPLLISFFSISLPAGVSLYWISQNLSGIILELATKNLNFIKRIWK